MDFSKMNHKGRMDAMKPQKCLTDLKVNKEFKLVGIKAIRTAFGRKILVECEEFVTFLPSRFDELTDEEIHQLKESNITEWGIKFMGLKDYGNGGKQARLVEFVRL